MLHEIEARLRRDGVLPEFAATGDALPLRAKGQVQASSDAERLKRLEAENAGLRAELAMLREQLSRFQAIDALLAETGRLAR